MRPIIKKTKIFVSNNLGDDLPLDIWREILLRLPAECLFRFWSVCKRWRRVIDDPNFARAHNIKQLSSSHTLFIKNPCCPPFHPLYTFNLDVVDFHNDDRDVQAISGFCLDLDENESPPVLLRGLPLSACNGLMLVVTDETIKTPLFEIWNLSTRERLQLPPLLGFSHSGMLHMFTGLGHDEAAQDLKVVAIQKQDLKVVAQGGQQAYVYSLRSDTWRKLIGGRPCISGSNGWWDPHPAQYEGVYMCGALHWLSSPDNKIVALDLGTEKHWLIELHPSHKKVSKKKIDVLGGCLVLSGFSSWFQKFDVWVMKDYGSDDDDESWTMLLSIKKEDLSLSSSAFYERLRPVAYMKDKNQVFVKDGGSEFLLFDVESNSIKKRVRIDGLIGNLNAQIIPRSIFRLRDHCDGGSSGITRIKPLFYRTTTMEMSIKIKTK